MPSADAGPVATYAETVAILAMLIDAGKDIRYKKVEDVTGERVAAVYQKRMKTLVNHAKLVAADWKNGGKGRLSDLVGDELNAKDNETAPPKSPKKRNAGSGASSKAKKTKVKDEPEADPEGDAEDDV